MPEARAGAFSRRHAALLFAVALIPRLAHFCFARHTPLAGEYVPDLSAYLYAVSRLMNGAYFFAEPMLMSPGYTFILAPQYILFGPNAQVFVLVNAVLDAGSAALCGALAARLAPAAQRVSAGLWAGGLYACCGPLLFYALLPLGEGPAIFCLLAGLALLLGPQQAAAEADGGGFCAPGPRAWLSGAMLGLALLTRPNLAPCAASLLAVWCLAGRNVPGGALRGSRLSASLRCAAGMLFVFAPFLAHNILLESRATPFGFQGGITFYVGNHPGASGVSEAVPGVGVAPYLSTVQAVREASRLAGRPLTLAGADAFWYAEAWRGIAANPGAALRLLGRKALLLVNSAGVDATANLDFSARFSPVPGLLPLSPGLVLAVGTAGAWLALARRRQCAAGAAVALAFAALAATVALFQATPRYRAPLLPLALALAGPMLAGAPEIARGRWRRLAGPGLCAALVLGLSLIPLRRLVDDSGRMAQEHARLARYYLLHGPVGLAPEEYAAALRLGGPAAADRRALGAEMLAALLLSGRGPR